MTTVQMTVNLQGLKRNCWRKNLNGFFTIGGKPLSDSHVRKVDNIYDNKDLIKGE